MRVVGGYVDADWGQVHYRRSGGSGPWIVLLHESPLSSAVYQHVLPLLGDRARAIAFDTPGYGASDPPPRDGFEIPDYAAVLVRAMGELEVVRPVLAGVHTGASIAIEAAHRLTGGAAGLALSGVALFTDDERAEFLASWTPKVPFDTEGSQFSWAIERYRRIWPELTADLLHLAVLELLRSGHRYDWGYRAAFRHDPAEPLRTADAPVLLLDAEHDMLADKDAVAQRLRPDAELVILPGLPGQPHLRAPDDYARELLAFATRCSGREGDVR
jgi:pimeloyl-ACP methyl ester carboxylesterase